MSVKRFKEVRRGYVSGAYGSGVENTIKVDLTSAGGLNLNLAGRGVVFMELMLLAISPQNATAGGCLIRRCMFQCNGSSFNVLPEMDHTSHSRIGAIDGYGFRTTPFPINEPQGTMLGTCLPGSYPLDKIEFSFSNPYAIASYYLHPALDEDTTVVHWQITMEVFEDTSVET